MFFITSFLAFLGGLVAILYKSKCSSCEIGWTGLRFERNVAAEVEEDLALGHHPPTTMTAGPHLPEEQI
jgi:hypothetical protein